MRSALLIAASTLSFLSADQGIAEETYMAQNVNNISEEVRGKCLAAADFEGCVRAFTKKREAFVDGRGVPAAVKTISTPSAVSLAEHLTKIGAVIYSAYWCPYCDEQKELFGQKGAAQLQVVECAEDGQNSQHELCERKGIDSFPTWEINGKLEPGLNSLNKLADLSLYEGSRQF